jgi:hypothetical protein
LSVWDFSGVTLISAISLTPRKLFQRFNDTAEIILAVSVTPRKSFQRCHWHRWNSAKKFCSWCPYEYFHFAIIVISAVSIKLFHWCQWHRGNRFEIWI